MKGWLFRGAAIGWLAIQGVSSHAAPRHVVLIDLDGVRRDTFATAYQEGKLPNFARVFGEAAWFDGATTVIPSVTMASQGSIVTGTLPVRHGVPGNQWYDRDTGASFDYLSASGITCVYGYTLMGGAICKDGIGNTHLQAPTVFEAAAGAGLTSISAYLPYWKGATRPGAPTAAETNAFLIKDNHLDYKRFDTQMALRAKTDLRAQGMPGILALYFGGTDLIGHEQGIAAEAQYLAGTVDGLFGDVLDVIAEMEPDWPRTTMFVLTSDHGRTPVKPAPEDKDLVRDLAEALPEGSHVASNGGVVFVYLKDAMAAEPLRRKLATNEKLRGAVASVRLHEAKDPQRAGDLILILKPGRYYNNTSPGSQHGSVYADDLSVPLVVAVPGVAGRHVVEPVSVTQIAGTIAAYLGFRMETADRALPLEPGWAASR